MQPSVVVLAIVAMASIAIAAGREAGVRMAMLVPIGAIAGIALYHSAFGFTSAWRRMLVDRRGAGIRAQLVMLAAAILVFFPLLDRGHLFGQELTGFVGPVGAALVLGAFLFGIGMQLGGGCGSGTLYTVGGGSVRMLVTLAAFVAGSLAATGDPLGWMGWPDLGGHSLVAALGGIGALAPALALLALLHLAVLRIERGRHGAAESLAGAGVTDSVRGPWSPLLGAIVLAAVNVACLVVAGRPWGITAAFALWGAKLAAAAGVAVQTWTYWRDDAALSASVFADATSMMNFGVIVGALAAAGFAGRFAPVLRVPPASLLAAILGGLLMGFGARLATGCNIGAFFSGIASGSLHGVVWLLAAVAGNAVGVRLRRFFALAS